MNIKHHHIPLFALVVLSAWGIFHLIAFMVLGLSSSNLQYIGQYGDFFGCLNTLFSGLAMVGATYAILLQRQSLEDFKTQGLLERQHQQKLARLGKLEEACTHLSAWMEDITAVMVAIRSAAKNNEQYDIMNGWRLVRSRRACETIVRIHFPQVSSDFDQLDASALQDTILKVVGRDPSLNVVDALSSAKTLVDKIYDFRGGLLSKINELIDAPKCSTEASL